MQSTNLFIVVCAVAIGWATGHTPLAVNAALPAESWCVNTDCTKPISTAITTVNNAMRPNDNYLTFGRNKPVKILSKSLDGFVYAIEFQGQRGFVKPSMIREERIIVAQAALLKVPIAQISWLKSPPVKDAVASDAASPTEDVAPEVAKQAATVPIVTTTPPPELVIPEENSAATTAGIAEASSADDVPPTAATNIVTDLSTEPKAAIDPVEIATPEANSSPADVTELPTAATNIIADIPLVDAAKQPVEEPIVVKKEAYLTTGAATSDNVLAEPQLEIVGATTTGNNPQSEGIQSAIVSEGLVQHVEAAPETVPEVPVKAQVPATSDPSDDTTSAPASQHIENELPLVNIPEDTGLSSKSEGSTNNETTGDAGIPAVAIESPIDTEPQGNEQPADVAPAAAVDEQSQAKEQHSTPAFAAEHEHKIEPDVTSHTEAPAWDSEIRSDVDDDFDDSEDGDDGDDDDNEDADADDEEPNDNVLEDDYAAENITELYEEAAQEQLANALHTETTKTSHDAVIQSADAANIEAFNKNETDWADQATTNGDNYSADAVNGSDYSLPTAEQPVEQQHHEHPHSHYANDHHQHQHQQPHEHSHSHYANDHHQHQHQQPHNPGHHVHTETIPPPLIHPALIPRRVPQFDAPSPPLPVSTYQPADVVVDNNNNVPSYLEQAAPPANVAATANSEAPVITTTEYSVGVGSVLEVNAPASSADVDVDALLTSPESESTGGVVSDVWGTISALFGNHNGDSGETATDEAAGVAHSTNRADTAGDYQHREIPVSFGGNDYCEPLTGDSACPSVDHPPHVQSHTGTTTTTTTTNTMQSVTDELSTVAQLFVEHIAALAATTAYTAITGLIVLLFLFGQRFVSNRGREQTLLSKLNIIERKLMTSGKECDQLRDQLTDAKFKLHSIEDSSFGSNEMVASVRRELAAKAAQTVTLQERVNSLEAELDTATEAGLELNRMVSDLLSNQTGSDSIISSVEEMQHQLNEQEEMTTAINALLAEKSRENSELQLQLANVDGKYNTELADVVTLNERLASEAAQLSTELAELRERAETQTRQLAAASAAQLAAVTTELEELRVTYETVRLANVSNEARVQVLEELVKEMRAGEPIGADLLDATRHRTELVALGKEKDRLADKLEGESDARRLLEDHVRVISEEMSALRLGVNAAEKDKLEAQTRLEVLSTYFKEKETQLQRELSLKEAASMKQLGETTSTVERIRGLQSDIAELRSQNDSLKAEIEAQLAAHKAQIAAAENRAHESWLGARQTQRRFEEAVSEAGALRRKLTSLSTSGVATADGSLQGLQTSTLDGADSSASPIHLDPNAAAAAAAAAATLNPGASALLMGVLPPPPFHPHASFMGPPPPLLPPLGYMPQSQLPLPLPPFMNVGGVGGGLPSLPPPPPPPGEMRPPPLGRLMSPPPLGVGALAGGAGGGGRYSPPMGDRDYHQRYHRNSSGGGGGGSGRYTPDEYAYDSDDDRHYDHHHHRGGGGGGGGRRSPYDTETDFSPPPSPEPHHHHHQRYASSRDNNGGGGGGGGRLHHNPATSRNSVSGNGGNGSNRSHLYSPPMSTKSDTTSRSKAGGLSSGSIESLGSRKSHHGSKA